MNTLLNLGTCFVALEHIVKAEFTPAYAGGEPMEENPDVLTNPWPAKLELTLTSVHLESYSEGMAEPQLSAASASDHLVLRGEIAERLAILMQGWAVIVELEGDPSPLALAQ